MKFRAAVAVLFGGVICAALLRQAPDVLDRPLLGGTPRGHNALPLTAVAEGGRVTRAATLHAADLAALAAYDELRLRVGTYDTSPRLDEGTITISGSCLFRAASQGLSENTMVSFRRQGDCAALPKDGDLSLRLTFAAASARDARAALWTSPVSGTDSALMTGTSGGDTFAPLGRALITRGQAATSRSQLLQYLWDVPSWLFWTIFGIATVLLVVGAVLAGHTARPSAAAAAFMLGSGLALFYAVIVPPLQAPDEPDHLLSFATLSARPDLAAATSSWAKRIHFYRMTFMADERFRPADREQAFPLDWPPAEVFAENVRHRSSTATRFWQALTPLVPGRPPHALLFLRIAQSLVFGVALGAGAALLARAGGAAPAIPALVLLIVPTLPFFGMHLSEIAFTLFAFVLIGYAFLLLRMGAPARLTGPLLGLSVALIAAGPRSGWPTIVVIGAAAMARILTGSARTATPGDLAWFWAGLTVPSLLLFATRVLWIPSPFYEQWHLASFDPRTGISTWSFLAALAAASCIGAVAEWIAGRATLLRVAFGRMARVVCALAALGLVVSVAWSVLAPLPVLSTVESAGPPSAWAYVQSVLLPLATAARVRQFDFLTWTSLWGGFGWADAILPAGAIAVVTVFATAAAIATLAADARDPQGRCALVTVCGAIGLAAAVAVAAYSSYGLHRNMHGRYLLGTCIIGLCLLAAPSLGRSGARMSAATRGSALLAFCCALHGFALCFLLIRYFG